LFDCDWDHMKGYDQDSLRMANTAADLFEKLLKHPFDPIVATKDALKRIGVLVDLAGDLGRDDGTAQALAWCDELSKRKLTGPQATLLDYFRINAWTNRQRLAQSCDPDSAWHWEQPGLQQQVFFGRRAVGSAGFEKLPAFRRCQILTNLGNQLSQRRPKRRGASDVGACARA
jgi:hypothetical protein